MDVIAYSCRHRGLYTPLVIGNQYIFKISFRLMHLYAFNEMFSEFDGKGYFLLF